MKQKPISECCKAELLTHYGVDGTNFWYCSKCQLACDPWEDMWRRVRAQSIDIHRQSIVKDYIKLEKSSFLSQIRRMKKREYVEDDVVVSLCPMNPPGKNMQHIQSKSGKTRTQCYRCGRSFTMPTEYTKKMALSDALKILETMY